MYRTFRPRNNFTTTPEAVATQGIQGHCSWEGICRKQVQSTQRTGHHENISSSSGIIRHGVLWRALAVLRRDVLVQLRVAARMKWPLDLRAHAVHALTNANDFLAPARVLESADDRLRTSRCMASNSLEGPTLRFDRLLRCSSRTSYIIATSSFSLRPEREDDIPT